MSYVPNLNTTGLSFEPIIGAIAAGNAVILKPSELAPTCSSVLANIIHDYLDTSAIKVIEGGSNVGEVLLRHKFDKIFFTGTIFQILFMYNQLYYYILSSHICFTCV